MPNNDALQPLWFATAPRAADVSTATPLPADVDVLVVGAGVTGLSTALHLAERGARVLVIDRGDVGHGTTGRSNGQIIAGLQQTPDALLKAYGETTGERLIAFAGAGPEKLFELVERHAIACDAERSGWIQASRSTHDLKQLETLARSWERRGVAVQYLDRATTARRIGTRAYAGAWVDPRNGTVQPLAYAQGLADASVRAGVALHCGVELKGLARRGARWEASTARATVTADIVVLATNVDTAKLEGFAGETVGRSFLTAYSVQIATDPLPSNAREEILATHRSCSDTGHLRLRYCRWDADGRFVMGGPGGLGAPTTADALSFRWLERSARRMFPALGDAPFVHHWAARDTVTLDIVPHLYEPCPGLFCALGFNGRGLAIGTALGDVLARRALGEPAEAMPFPTTAPSRSPLNLPATLRFYLGLAGRRFHH